MLDHVFLSVSDIERSIAFYTQALAPLGITDRVDFDGKDGPPGHPDHKGFGCKGRFILWLRLGVADSRAAHVGFIAKCGPRSIQPMPPRWRRARPTMANQVLGAITIRVTMPAACSTPTATASNLFSSVGSTPSPNRLGNKVWGWVCEVHIARDADAGDDRQRGRARAAHDATAERPARATAQDRGGTDQASIACRRP